MRELNYNIQIDGFEKMDRKDLILGRKGEAEYLRGHKKKIQKRICLNDAEKYSFLQRSIDTWNGLKEVIMARNIQLKERLDKYRYEDKITQV